MCLFVLCYRVCDDAPLIVAANREEYFARGGEPPRLLPGVRAVGGYDPRGGGTWFGVNAFGVMAAVTNRPKSSLPSKPRSRGLLVLDLLQHQSSSLAAKHAIAELDANRYDGCNIICADFDQATVIHAGDWLRVRTLPPGIHAISSNDVNDASDGRIAYALGRLSPSKGTSLKDYIRTLQALCGETECQPPICWRDAERGTVCSSIVALKKDLARSLYLHADGPPRLHSL
ncbi:MAG: hypothetical protein KatS3mg105_1240 [Gemmatales bacterium]|nr:MAG: hypothetical protein KatS3mg105_1240 [Gemmatales bacterium]